MDDVFYRYASGTPGKAVIDPHYIILALDQWCWYWIVLEATFVAFVLGVIFLCTKRFTLAAGLFLGVLVALGCLDLIQHHQCAAYAFREVEEILTDAQRKAAIVAVFRGLPSITN